MQATLNLPMKILLLFGAIVVPRWSSAGEPADLPHAFDAGWQGEKTCELLYETDSVRVGQCSFPPGVGHEKHFHNPHYGYLVGVASAEELNQEQVARAKGDALLRLRDYDNALCDVCH